MMNDDDDWQNWRDPMGQAFIFACWAFNACMAVFMAILLFL
jgi:hypothetical protein